jgi:hypothetical protein
MILLAINATDFTELSKILCIFVEISEQILQFILDFFCRRRKNWGVGAEGCRHIKRQPQRQNSQPFFAKGEKRMVKNFFSKTYLFLKSS